MKRLAAEAVFSVVFFQLALTPIAFWVWGMSVEQYGAWTLTNCALSPFLGVAYARLHRAVFRS